VSQREKRRGKGRGKGRREKRSTGKGVCTTHPIFLQSSELHHHLAFILSLEVLSKRKAAVERWIARGCKESSSSLIPCRVEVVQVVMMIIINDQL